MKSNRYRLFENAHDVFFAHHEEFFTVYLDGLTGVLAEQNTVTDLHVHREELAGFVALAGTHSEDFALIGLFTGGVRKDNAAGGRWPGCILNSWLR